MSVVSMCDEADGIDEFIVFELTKECESLPDEEFQHVEEIIEEVDDDIDGDILLMDDEDRDVKQLMEERLEDDELDQTEYKFDYTDQVESEQQENFYQPDEEQQPEEEEEEQEEEEEEIKVETNEDTTIPAPPPPTKPLSKRKFKGPMRYLLFDELVATIVDYDEEQTPIVEFAMSGSEADERLPVECGICPDVMHKSKLSKHLKTHMVADGTKRYACIYCEETYKDYKYLAGHSRRHMGIRPYVCEICKLYFSTKQDLRVHNQRRHHAKDLICEICGKSFSQNTMLKRHREATHEKKLRFRCTLCPKAYYKNFALQEHIRNVHMGQRRMLTCPFCGMQCRDAHKMARHRKELHLNQTNYQCLICHEQFTNINYFDAHKRSIQCRNNTRRNQEDLQLQKLEEVEEEEDQPMMAIAMEDDQELLEPNDANYQCLIDDELVYEITLENDEEN